jgi:hypothetical protein
VTIVRAEPHACNEQGNTAGIYQALTAPRLTLRVVKATHCDPEWPSDPGCTLTCGAPGAERQARFRRYAMATLDHVLLCSTTAAPWLGGVAAKGDKQVTAIASAKYPPGQLGCVGLPDGGADLSGADAAVGSDGAAGPDAAAKGDGTGAGDQGCGCRVVRSGREVAASLWPLVLLGALLLLGRHGRRSCP